MTVYLFAVQEEQCFNIKQIHKYDCDYLCDWFSKLGSYTPFPNRLNQLSEDIRCFTSSFFEDFSPSNCLFSQSLVDSPKTPFIFN